MVFMYQNLALDFNGTYMDMKEEKEKITYMDCRDIFFNHPYLKQLIIIGPDQKQLEATDLPMEEKLICISIQELEGEKAEKKFTQIDTSVPFYLSIDKDVMSESCAVTNWNLIN